VVLSDRFSLVCYYDTCIFFLMILPPPRYTLFPYTTLFRSNGQKMWITNGGFADVYIVFAKVNGEKFTAFILERTFPGFKPGNERSEEHTSELQSHLNLVCRLLLEKKKHNTQTHTRHAVTDQ